MKKRDELPWSLTRVIEEIKKEPGYRDEESINESLAEIYDDNYAYEEKLTFGGKRIYSVESLWTDNIDGGMGYPVLMVHVDSEEFEGDVIFDTMSRINKLRIIRMIKKHREELKEKGQL